MKKIIILLAFTISLFGVEKSVVEVYAKVSANSVKIKWIPQEYSSKNSYKLYKNDVLIASLKPTAYEDLVRDKYSQDYMFIIYPFRDVKSLDEQILAFKAEKQAAGFRILMLMQDNKFAKNLGQFYEDKLTDEKKTLVYRLEMYQNFKKIGSKTFNIEPKKITPEDKVSIVHAQSASDGVSLSWDSKNSYAFYNVYRKLQSEKEFTKITATPVYKSPMKSTKALSSFKDKALKKAQKAEYYVTKLDMFYEESTPSQTVSAERLAYNRPQIVKNIFVKNKDNKITLRWAKITGVVGYNVYRSSNYNGGYKKLNSEPIKEEAYFDKDFKVDQNYYYYVTSLNKQGESFASAKMLAYARDVTPPSIPNNLSALVKAGSVALTWEPSKDNDVIGYRIYMAMDANASTWSMVAKDIIKESNYIHMRPKTLSRNAYFYHVKAVDKSFNESAMSNIIKIKLPDVTAPKQPRIHAVRAYPFKVTLEWSKSAEYDFAYYNVYKNKTQKLNKEPLLRNFFIDTIPSSAQSSYSVTAVDTSGNESEKTEVTAVNGLDLNPVNIEDFQVKKSKNGVQIIFTCKNSDYSGFEVFRSGGNDKKYYNISSFQRGMSFTDTSISKNMTYFYMLKAYDKVGNIAQSNILSIKYE